MKNRVILLTFCFFTLAVAAQETKKTIAAFRIEKPLILDGILDEACYSQAVPARNFVQIQPYNGKPAMQPSESWVFFDESALYVSAMLYDSAPDSIYNYLTTRDNTGTSDYFGVYIDPFNQGQLAFGFFITPSGAQIDIKATKVNGGGDNEDSNWNAVWESKTRILDKGWTVEMRIPYSELRFSEKAGSTWGINFCRNTRRYNSNTSWCLIDRKINGFIDQQGHLTGIRDIDPPVRLSFTPYLATYFESKDAGSDDFLYKGGLDLKYGINESFTLDMMLVPDFGQIQSDDKQLNLSPYELYYSENRQFFTESTELFERAGIFYSRRIGAGPKFSDKVTTADNEKIDYNPSETQLVNATKISGRTDKGWGVGFLNAMSLPSYAKVRNTETGTKREVRVQPFTNYNVSVVDKSLKNNSYISFINSNVYMFDSPFRANVTGTEFELRDKTKTYALSGKGALSIRGEQEKESGYYGYLALKKNKGNFLFGLENTVYSDTYNPNDLGYLQNNNQVQINPWIYRQIAEPFSVFRELNGDIWYSYNRIYHPSAFSNQKAGYELNATFTNNYQTYFNGGYQTETYDYFEPRVKRRYYFAPASVWNNFNINTDWRKPLNFYFYYGFTNYLNSGQFSNTAEFTANYQIGQRLKLSYDLYFKEMKNNVGYVANNDANDSIHFAKRNVYTISNVISASYVFTNKISMTLRGRHYWSGAENKIYYLLQDDGDLAVDASYTENKDQNYNALTVDMNFRWVFAPGSELVLAWKDAAYTSNNLFKRNYRQNLCDSWRDQANSISVKVLYYINYSKLMHRKS